MLRSGTDAPRTHVTQALSSTAINICFAERKMRELLLLYEYVCVCMYSLLQKVARVIWRVAAHALSTLLRSSYGLYSSGCRRTFLAGYAA